ncbi:Trans-acting T-cell-specific transcription factor GATA-3 [Datura stramonium]|uniref:Trans-acting T-cell-specific transcription factor GATA-3 n=1 Tax=Datura stramonium TaxID=4076 RepID=A0ABS8RIZ6_DATST|nr:Trans-acting T-cell-specific transcription factor GATA-3 [Datura stramonium]
MVKREMVEEAMAHGVCFIHLKPISTNLLKKVWHHVYRHQIKAKQESEHKVNNLVEVMDNTSCASNKIQDRKGKSIMNPSKTYHDQEVGTLLEKDNAKGSKRIRSIDEESPDLEKEDHSLGSKNTMKGREKKRPAMEWTLKLDKKFKEAVHMLGDKARPKLIMEIMNVPNLSRKQVSNYLQRYRVEKRQAQHVQPSTSSIVNQCKIKSPILSSLDPISHSQDGVNEEYHQLKFMRETRTSLQECLGEKQALNIESTIGNFNSASQRLCFPDKEYHFNVLDSNEFPINFDEPLLEGYSTQPPAVPSLVPPNDFFAGINDWNQELELDNFNCASQRLYFSNDGHHFSTFNNLPDNGHHFNVFDANGFPINFNEPLQEGYSPQPPEVPSLAPPDDFFTGLDNWIQEPELNNFNGDHNVSTRSVSI